MNLDEIFCGDLESDNLLEEASKIHVFSFGWKVDGEWKVDSTNDYAAIARFFSNPNNVIAIHNGVRFDALLVEKILGIEVKATVIDTLALAWYVDFGRDRYGLEPYGESFGVPKPPVDDWEGLTKEEIEIIEFYEREI